MDVFFEALNYETIEQKKAYEVAGLLGTKFPTSVVYSRQVINWYKNPVFYFFFFSGDIGGQMGLFIGASILTLLELVDYLYEVREHNQHL